MSTDPDDISASVAPLVRSMLEAGETDIYHQVIASTETGMFKSVMEHTSNNLSRAAQILGISRFTLRKKLRQLGLSKRQKPFGFGR
jgi:two-component system nitrogen regulation response regulator GlnG